MDMHRPQDIHNGGAVLSFNIRIGRHARGGAHTRTRLVARAHTAQRDALRCVSCARALHAQHIRVHRVTSAIHLDRRSSVLGSGQSAKLVGPALVQQEADAAARVVLGRLVHLGARGARRAHDVDRAGLRL
eukprot:4939989-Prymnesium_polylepis.1